MNCFGIDFGTTNSEAFELNTEVCFGDEEGRPLPSVVKIDKATGRISCGRDVERQRLEMTERGGFHVIPSVKELLDSDREWFSGPKRWTVAMVAAEVLRKLSDNAESRGFGRIKEAVISIPVGMSPRARRVLREAARIAGIQVKGFVKESTAALIRDWQDHRNHRHVAVFDWGGGTLDISVLQIAGSQILELATRGIPVAGNRIDEALSHHMHAQLMESSKQLEEMPEDVQDNLRTAMERVKCRLSEVDEDSFTAKGYGENRRDVRLSRRDLQGVIRPFVVKALDTLAETIASAKLSVDSLDDIKIIGGCSKLWLFKEMLAVDERFAGFTTLADSPEWDVARGAAIVQKTPGSYVLGENLSLQLSDGDGFPLALVGDRFDNVERRVEVGLVEDARAANIIVDRSSEHGQGRSTVLQLAVPTQGFDLEGIELSYRLTEDLTFHLKGKSRATAPGRSVEGETGELHFRYSVEG